MDMTQVARRSCRSIKHADYGSSDDLKQPKSCSHLVLLMKGIIRNKLYFLFLFVQTGGLSSFLTVHRMIRDWKIWGQTVHINKCQYTLLEAQVYFLLTTNVDSEPSRQSHPSSGFWDTMPHPSHQRKRTERPEGLFLCSWLAQQRMHECADNGFFPLVLARMLPSWYNPCIQMNTQTFPFVLVLA